MSVREDEEVCGNVGWVRETGKILRGGAWGLHSACLLYLPCLSGARWPLNAPEREERACSTLRLN